MIFGSFANVVIHRFPRGESLSHPGSHCPGCDAPIVWYDNVPLLSWAALRGKCRRCGEPISIRYPLVELASGALWVLAWALFGASWRTLFGIVFFYLLLILAAIDIDTYRLPNRLVAVLAGAGVIGVAVSAVTGTDAVPLLGHGSPLVLAAVGALSSGGVALAIALLYEGVRKRSGFGMGDVKLLAVIGVFLGPYGLLVLFVGSLIAAAAGIRQAMRSQQGLSARVPFGPFLALAAVIVTVAGPAAWAWYWGLVR